MSYSIDANILLYAVDRSSSRHERAYEFLQKASKGPEILAITWPVIMAFLRIATHPSIFTNPLSPQDAQSNIASLISLPHVRLLSEADGFWQIFNQIADGISLRGNIIPDAHIAAILRQHGVTTIFTGDTDFRKFSFLRVHNPFE